MRKDAPKLELKAMEGLDNSTFKCRKITSKLDEKSMCNPQTVDTVEVCTSIKNSKICISPNIHKCNHNVVATVMGSFSSPESPMIDLSEKVRQMIMENKNEVANLTPMPSFALDSDIEY